MWHFLIQSYFRCHFLISVFDTIRSLFDLQFFYIWYFWYHLNQFIPNHGSKNSSPSFLPHFLDTDRGLWKSNQKKLVSNRSSFLSNCIKCTKSDHSIIDLNFFGFGGQPGFGGNGIGSGGLFGSSPGIVGPSSGGLFGLGFNQYNPNRISDCPTTEYNRTGVCETSPYDCRRKGGRVVGQCFATPIT